VPVGSPQKPESKQIGNSPVAYIVGVKDQQVGAAIGKSCFFARQSIDQN
jgi:hypothetical protein